MGGMAQSTWNQRYSMRAAFAALAAASAFQAHAQVQLAVNPWFPAYTQPVQVELRGANTYLPATRYARSADTIIVDFEYPGGANVTGADFGSVPLNLGELAPGAYRVLSRLYDISNPNAAPQQLEQQVQVAPPDAPGVYVVPQAPNAYQQLEVVVRGEYQVDPLSLKATFDGSVLRVEYSYAGDRSTYDQMYPGFAAYGKVRVAGLPPGWFRIEAVGTDRRWSTYQNRATSNVTVGGLVDVVEYYAPSLDHYFISAWPDEVAALDANMQTGFMRTGQRFRAWLKASEAPPQAVPVCRFYASGPNSHFYTADPSECTFLKSLEKSERSEASAKGEKFTGWQFEAIAFFALAPVDGVCPANTQPVYRDYNNRWQQNDSNHRFVVNARQREAMKAGSAGWIEERVAFCSPQ
jgi:hypothetical protein